MMNIVNPKKRPHSLLTESATASTRRTGIDMLLTHLCRESVTMVVDKVDASDKFRLYGAGSKSMNAKFAPSVTSVEVRPQDFTRAKWPNFKCFPRVRSFSTHADYPPDAFVIPNAEECVGSLPWTLTSISLMSSQTSIPFAALVAKEHSAFSQLTKLRLVLMDDSRSENDILEFVYRSQHITCLALKKTTMLEPFCIQKDRLPQTLTELVARPITLCETPESCAKFPPKLESLAIMVAFSDQPYIVESLPPNLLRLDCRISTSRLEGFDTRRLPTSLTSLRVFVDDVFNEDSVIRDFFAGLPRGITFVHISHHFGIALPITVEQYHTLPIGLTSNINCPVEIYDSRQAVMCGGKRYLGNFNPENFNTLIRSSWSQDPHFQGWGNVFGTAEIVNNSIRWCEPPPLHLMDDVCNILGSIGTEQVTFPPHLRSLSLSPPSKFYRPGTVHHYPGILPKTLTNLVLHGVSANIRDLPLLTTLKLSFKSQWLSDGFLFPKQLRSIVIMMTIANFAEEYCRLVQLLPSSLMNLMIQNEDFESKDVGFENIHFASLPRSLTMIRLPKCNVTSACAKYLPPNLQYLSIGGMCPSWIQLDEKDLRYSTFD